MEPRTDCPECSSAGSVERGECQVCFAEFPELSAVPEAGMPGSATAVPA